MSINEVKNKNSKSNSKTKKLGQAAFLASLVASSIVAPASSAFAETTEASGLNENGLTFQEQLDLDANRTIEKDKVITRMRSLFPLLEESTRVNTVDANAARLIADNPLLGGWNFHRELIDETIEDLREYQPDNGNNFDYAVITDAEVARDVKALLVEDFSRYDFTDDISALIEGEINRSVDENVNTIRAEYGDDITTDIFVGRVHQASWNDVVAYLADNRIELDEGHTIENVSASDIASNEHLRQEVYEDLLDEFWGSARDRGDVREHVDLAMDAFLEVPGNADLYEGTIMSRVKHDARASLVAVYSQRTTSDFGPIRASGLTAHEAMFDSLTIELSQRYASIPDDQIATAVVESYRQVVLQVESHASADLREPVRLATVPRLDVIMDRDFPDAPETPDAPTAESGNQDVPDLGDEKDLPDGTYDRRDDADTIDIQFEVKDGIVFRISKFYPDRIEVQALGEDGNLGFAVLDPETGNFISVSFTDRNDNQRTNYYDGNGNNPENIVSSDVVTDSGTTQNDGIPDAADPQPTLGDGIAYEVEPQEFFETEFQGYRMTVHYDDDGFVNREVIYFDDGFTETTTIEGGVKVSELRDNTGELVSITYYDANGNRLPAVDPDGELITPETEPNTDDGVYGSAEATGLTPIRANDSQATRFQWKLDGDMVTVTDQAGYILVHLHVDSPDLGVFLAENRLKLPGIEADYSTWENPNAGPELVDSGRIDNADGTPRFVWQLDVDNTVTVFSWMGSTQIRAQADSPELAEWLINNGVEIPGIRTGNATGETDTGTDTDDTAPACTEDSTDPSCTDGTDNDGTEGTDAVSNIRVHAYANNTRISIFDGDTVLVDDPIESAKLDPYRDQINEFLGTDTGSNTTETGPNCDTDSNADGCTVAPETGDTTGTEDTGHDTATDNDGTEGTDAVSNIRVHAYANNTRISIFDGDTVLVDDPIESAKLDPYRDQINEFLGTDTGSNTTETGPNCDTDPNADGCTVAPETNNNDGTEDTGDGTATDNAATDSGNSDATSDVVVHIYTENGVTMVAIKDAGGNVLRNEELGHDKLAPYQAQINEAMGA